MLKSFVEKSCDWARRLQSSATTNPQIFMRRSGCLVLILSFLAATAKAQSGIVAPIPLDTQATSISNANGIQYHGGPIISTPHVYFIWYGFWPDASTARKILPTLINGLSGTSYFNINTTYSDNTGRSVTNSVDLRAQVFDNLGSQGTELSDQKLLAVVARQLDANALPLDPDGIYFVLTSKAVTEAGSLGEFCFQFCGFHTHATLRGIDIKYAFVGDINRCLANTGLSDTSQCTAQELKKSGVGPNSVGLGDLGADAMANVMVHELNETVTDPDLNAWFDASSPNGEVGDKCAFVFGKEFNALTNGAPADIMIGGTPFLIQETWLNFGGGSCAMAFTTPVAPDFRLGVNTNRQTAPQGGDTTYVVTITPQGGFKDLVYLQPSGQPSGVRIKFDHNPALPGTSNMNVHIDSTVPVGTYQITITGTSGALPPHNIGVQLTVAPAPDFTIVVSPSVLSSPLTTCGTVSVSAVNGFTDDVDLTLTGLESTNNMARAQFTPQEIKGGSGSSTVCIASQCVPQGNYALTITGTQNHHAGQQPPIGHSTSATFVQNLCRPIRPNHFVTNMSAASGTVGTSITIGGTGFGATQGTNTVTINGSATTPTSWSDASITVPVPASPITEGDALVWIAGVPSDPTTFTVAPSISISPQIYDWGYQPAGTSTPTAFTLTNQGNTAVSVTDITLSAYANLSLTPTEFTQSNTCGSSLSPGAACTLTLKFSPTTIGLQSLSFWATASDSTRSRADAWGTGYALTVNPSSFDFGSVTVGSFAAQSFTVTNNANQPVSISAVQLSASGNQNASASGDFSLGGTTCTGSLGAHQTCAYTVQFNPSVSGLQEVSVWVNGSDPYNYPVNVSGTGATPPPPGNCDPSCVLPPAMY